MTYVRTFEDFAPPARVDDIPFSEVLIEESVSSDGPWITIDTQALDPLDDDPTHPASRSFTTGLATLDPVAWYRLVWRDENLSTFNSDPIFFPSETTHYTTPNELRDELDLDAVVLPDAEAAKLIQRAEDIVDEMLGARTVDPDTGRKIEVDVHEDWQIEKLDCATVLTAAFLHKNPDWSLEQRYASVGGDVGSGGPIGSPIPGVAMLLNASGLRRLTTTTSGGRRESVIGNLPEPD